MKLRNTIAAGLGLAACLCLAIAATTAQQPREREPYTIHRVTGDDLSTSSGQQQANQEERGLVGAQSANLDDAPRLSVAPGPQRVVVSDSVEVLRGGVPGECGDTLVTQNFDPDTVLIGAGTVACSQANGTITVENSWARCFPGSDFPNDLVLQCVDIGVESNTSPPDNPFDIDVRIVDLTPTATFPALTCPLPTGQPALEFGDPANNDTWFDVPPEFTVLHIQKVRVANDFQGMLRVTLNKLVTIPAGTDVLVEVHAPDRAASSGGDNGAFRVGSNEANASGATYIWAPQCGLNDYQDVVSIDPSFTADFVLRLDGTEGAANLSGICCDNTLGGGCDPTPTTFDLCNGPTDRFCPNAVACPTAGDPFCPTFEGPNSPPCPFVVENDNCDGLIVLSNSVCLPFNSVIATDSGVVNPPGFETVNNDVFFGYIVKGVPPLPNNAGRLIVSTFGSTFDTNVAVYRVTAGDIQIPANLALICADIAAGGGANAVGQSGGFGDDIDNRPAARINPLTYLCIIDAGDPIVPGDQFVIRVGSPFPGVGGDGFINVDYLPTDPAPWTSGGDPGGRCCLANGDCVMVPTLADCQALDGFFRNVTDFYFGRDPAVLAADPILFLPALIEITCVGCKALPCAPVGEACFNPIDLKATLLAKTGTAFGTVTRLIKNKLYYKYQIPAGCAAIEIDTCGSTDAAGGGGFDTFIEVFKWSPTYPNNCLTDGEADIGNLPTVANPVPGVTGPGTTGQWLVVNGQVIINDDCRFDDEPENLAAQGATLAAPCYNNQNGTETDSCLCFPTGTSEGNNPGDWILICVGQFNPERQPSGVNSIDPVENPTFDPVLASVSIRCLIECFNCELDTTGFTIDLVEPEPICVDGVPGTNDGCNAVLVTSTGGPVTVPQTTPIAPTLNVPFYITGNSGIFDIDGVTQHEDNDWYQLDLADAAKLTLQLVQAEFTAQIAILKAGNPATSNLCNTTGFLLNTLTPCDDDTMDDLTIDVCPGTYYLMIRPRPPFKPVPCGTDSEYLMCVTVKPQKAVNCCPGDANNDGILDGSDIQRYVNLMLHPPASGTGLRLGGCYQQDFCHVDADLDGFLSVADADQFVALLLSKSPCIPKPDQCIDHDRCQLPDNNAAIGSTVVSSDRNVQSFNADPDVPDDFRAADNFLATADGNITDVCWWGAYTDRDAIFQENAAGVDCLNVDDFTITYYTNIISAENFDNCPDQVKAGPFSVAPTRVATGNIIQLAFGDVTEYQYEASHAAVHVTAGECLWVSIVNNTTGRCTWRWETSPFGNGRAFQQENRNQGNNVFPTEWDCLRDRTGAGFDLAFCLNILLATTGADGCNPATTVLGQCCYIDGGGQQQCVVVTAGECAVNFDGQFASGGTCASPCPLALCRITCQTGDVREAEGCGFDKNGGCDDDVMNPPIVDIGVLACTISGVGGTPITVCGTANNTDQPGIDSDWYSFTTTGNTDAQSNILLEFEAQPNMIIELHRPVAPDTPGTDGCSEFLASVTSTNGDCTSVAVAPGCLPDGEYFVRVLSSFTRAVPCDESTYRFTLSCTTPCCQFPNPCPPSAHQETTPCDEILQNDGCAQVGLNLFEPIPPAFEPCNFPNGKIFCGTAWAENNNNDQDWWLLPELTTSRVINISFRSEFPGNVFMVDVGDAPIGNTNDCIFQNLLFSATFAASVDCGGPGGATFAEFSECIPAGNWAVVVTPGRADGGGVFAGTPKCSLRNNYQMIIKCGATDCAPECFAGAGGSQLPKVQGINVGLGGDCGAGLIDRSASDKNALTNFRSADNFLAVSGGDVSEVQWWGFYENTVPATTVSCVPQTGDVADDFTITYYGSQTILSAIPGVGTITLPDNVVLGGPFSQFGATLSVVDKAELPDSKVQINFSPPDFISLVRFRATHAPVNFTAGTCVWMEIVNDTTGGNCTWSWAVSDDGDLKAARRDGDPVNDPQQFYKDGDMCRLIDLAWCVDIKTGPTGCFVFDPAPNDVCAGATLASFNLTCTLGSGGNDSVTYDLINYSSQGPTFEPSTLGALEPGGNPFNHLDCELNEFGLGTPPKEAVAWFSLTPTGGGAGSVSLSLTTPTFAEILVFNPVGAGAVPVDCDNIAGAGEIGDTQFLCSVDAPPVVTGTFVSGQTYLIMVSYYDGLVVGRANIFQSLSQTLVATCVP